MINGFVQNHHHDNIIKTDGWRWSVFRDGWVTNEEQKMMKVYRSRAKKKREKTTYGEEPGLSDGVGVGGASEAVVDLTLQGISGHDGDQEQRTMINDGDERMHG